MGRRNFSDEHFGANEDEVIESLQEDVEEMQRTARLYAARCRDLEAALKELLDSIAAEYPPFEAGAAAQVAWSDRRAKARNKAASLLQSGGPDGGTSL